MKHFQKKSIVMDHLEKTLPNIITDKLSPRDVSEMFSNRLLSEYNGDHEAILRLPLTLEIKNENGMEKYILNTGANTLAIGFTI